MKKIKVLIVDDSILIRKLFEDILSSQPDIEVLDTAIDPFDAREKIKRLNPDVLTLDIEMPKMDGISFLEKIMTLRPMPVIMVSTLTTKGAEITLKALELGAVDYIAKPSGIDTNSVYNALKSELVTKIKIAAQVQMAGKHLFKDENPAIIQFNPTKATSNVVAIGSSTGGVEALRDIFIKLPANSPPIVIAQHMPAAFTKSFAARLDSLSQVNVSEAVDGAPLKPGYAYVAPGGIHLTVAKRGFEYVCKLHDGENVSGHKPSVDVLFESVAKNVGDKAVGVILTGMGKDGSNGMLKMREAGAYNIGQSESSCIVYGMPKAANLIGAVHDEFDLQDIPAAILNYCENKREHHG